MRALTIGELETESGTSRSTIYYYVRAGLLAACPEVQPDAGHLHRRPRRAARARSTVSSSRASTSTPSASSSQHRVHSASQNGEDLVARQEEETRRAILAVAGREFSRNGYRQTRIADIIAELGITPQTLYGFFPTKRDLFAAAYLEYLDRVHERHRASPAGRGRPGRAPALAHGRRLRLCGRSTPTCCTCPARPPTTTPRPRVSCGTPTSTSSPGRRGTWSGRAGAPTTRPSPTNC